MGFVDVPFTTTASDMATDAIARLQDQWPGWEPNDGDLEVIQIETIAPMAQDALEVAASVPEAIFRNYGTQLVGEAYRPGTSATGSATFTALDDAGYYTDGQVQLVINGYAFETDDPIVIAAGQTQVTQDITALETGADYNGLGGPADPITAVPWLVSIVVADSTDSGVDAEDDAAYRDRLADFLKLQSTTLVTARDYELMALQQTGIGRATATFDNARKVTVTIADEAGELITDTAIKDNLVALYEGYRQVNTLYVIADPKYTTIAVVYDVVVLPGYDLTDVDSRIQDAVTNWLSPANWGRPQSSAAVLQPDIWLGTETVVRYSELIRILSVDGVRYVDTTGTTLNGGTADITLATDATHPVPLTRPGSITGTVAPST